MRREFNTDWLARVLALKHPVILYRPASEPSADDIAAATERLNALPADQQLLTACQALGFNVLEYLTEKARFNYEVESEADFAGHVEWEGMDGA